MRRMTWISVTGCDAHGRRVAGPQSTTTSTQTKKFDVIAVDGDHLM
jgi:hypothetical protein